MFQGLNLTWVSTTNNTFRTELLHLILYMENNEWQMVKLNNQKLEPVEIRCWLRRRQRENNAYLTVEYLRLFRNHFIQFNSWWARNNIDSNTRGLRITNVMKDDVNARWLASIHTQPRTYTHKHTHSSSMFPYTTIDWVQIGYRFSFKHCQRSIRIRVTNV